MLLQKPNTTVFLDTESLKQAQRMKNLGWVEVSKAQAKEAVAESVAELEAHGNMPMKAKKPVKDTADLLDLTVTELKVEAEKRGLEGFSGMRKDELIALLENDEGGE
jgi:hypothetical protein